MSSRPFAFAPVVLALIALPVLVGCPSGPDRPAAASGATATKGAETGPIKIGEYGSLTGSTATFGQSTKKGIELAIEEINAAGGVLGRQLEVIVEDDQGKPEEAAAVVQKLINRDKVVAVLGEVASSRSLAAAPICQKAGIPMITPSSTNPQVTEVGDYIFRVCFTDPFQGEALARFAHGHLGARKAAILTDIRNDYSVGLAQFFKEPFTRLGGSIVSEVSYSEGDKDFKGQLTQIKSASPDVIVVPGYYTEAGLIAQQARELGISQPMLGGDGWESPKLLEIAQGALEGSYYSNHYFAGDPNPVVQNFVQKFQARFGEEPDSIAALAYDAAKLLASAMEEAKSTKGSDVRDVLARTRNFQGVAGTITLDENRNPVKPLTFLKVSGGAIAFEAAVGGDDAAPGGASGTTTAPAGATTTTGSTAPAPSGASAPAH